MEIICIGSQKLEKHKKINQIIKDIAINHFDGIGKPEPLKENLLGYLNRHIDGKNRLFHSVNGKIVEIHQCRYNYFNKLTSPKKACFYFQGIL